MFCANCGKELQEGEVCTCTQKTEAVNDNPPVDYSESETTVLGTQGSQPQVNEEPVQQESFNPEPQQGYYNPVVNNVNVFPGAYYDPTQAYTEEQEDPAKNKKLPPRCDYPEGYKIKKKYVAVLLALSIGVFGIHNYYLGESNKGLIQLLLATVGGIFTVGIATIAVAVWATVEGVLLFTENIDRDANGYKIQTFEEAIAAQMKKD